MTEKTLPIIIAETERLLLRELNDEDYPDLCRVLQDEEVTYAYERTFSDREIGFWLQAQYRHYREDGFGMWAVVLKETGKMIGHAGVSLQSQDNKDVHEIGYLFEKACWGKGYATEAVAACVKTAFDTLGLERVYSVIRTDNLASRSVVRKNGMHIVETVYRLMKGKAIPHYVYCLVRPQVQEKERLL